MKKYHLHFGAFGNVGVVISNEKTGLSNYASRNFYSKKIQFDNSPTKKDIKEVAKLLATINA